MAEETWQRARLIPTSGINGQEEAERRATSALLAVVGAVRDFGLAMFRPLGCHSGQFDTYIEVPFKDGDRTVYPDGLIRVTRGGRVWTALLEIKTGTVALEKAQVETYLDVARDNGHQAVLTISNQIAPAPGVHPVQVDRRKVRKVSLHHMSWAEVLTIAVQQRVHRGISDPDQAWILGELIRYLEHPRSGALDFGDMGQAWVPVRDAVLAGTLRASDKGLGDVVSRWEQLLRFAALRLGRELGADVQVQVPRKASTEPTVLFAAQAQSLVQTGCLKGTIRIPDAAAPMDVVADLRSGRVTVSADLAAPRDGRATTRVNWLVRQLRDAPETLRIEAFTVGSRISSSELLRSVREDPAALIDDPRKELRSFRVAAASALGSKRGTGRGAFIDSVLAALDGFYEEVLQQLRPWSAKAPQLPKGGRTAVESVGIDVGPPPQDLSDPIDLDDNGFAIDHSPEASEASAPAANPSPSTDHAHAFPQAEFVSWDSAQARLDNERIVDDEMQAPEDSTQIG